MIPEGLEALHRSLPALLEGVEGHLTGRESRLLAFFGAVPTAEGEVLEIGSFKGKSTIVLAKAATLAGERRIVAVDPLTSPSETDPDLRGAASGWDDFKANLERAGVTDAVEFHQEFSSGLAAKWPAGRKLRLLWIDGDHTYRGAKTDFDLYRPHLAPGAVIAFHDALHQIDGPIRVIAEDILPSPDFGPVRFCGSIAWGQHLPGRGNAPDLAEEKRRIAPRVARLARLSVPGASKRAKERYLFRVARFLVPHGEVPPAALLGLLRFGTA